MTPAGGARSWLLVLDTATTRVVVAAGAPDGRLIRTMHWPAGHRHGEQLLPGVEELMAATGLTLADLGGIVVGTGPGAFTGLRVGLATAKALAHATSVPLAGIGTGEALLRAAAGYGDIVAGATPLVLLLPAGPRDRVAVRQGHAPLLLPGGTEPDLGPADRVLAVDLPDRAPADAVAHGLQAHDGLAGALLELGATRILAGDADDPERLIPEYVTLPRGIRAASGEIEWSRDPR